VLANGRPLRLPPQLLPSEAYGYDWAVSGAGARWLALAILADATNDHRIATEWAHSFAEQVITRLKEERWEMTSLDVLRWIISAQQDRERSRARGEK
jgi:hypothetical protein